jgi:hypothetical protein
VSAYGGIGPTLVVSGTHTAYIGTIGINPFVAGPGISITQSAGNITISGHAPQTPTTIVSVTGGDGDQETLADDLIAIGGRIDQVISWQLPYNAPAGIPLVSAAGRSLRTASSYVSSVMGRTGTVTLTTLDITKASGARCAYQLDGSSWSSVPFVLPGVASSISGLSGSIVVSSLSLWDSGRAWLASNNEEVQVHPNYVDSFRSAIKAADTFHSHGSISSSGAVGSASGKILVTSSGGQVTAVSSISTTQITNYTATSGAVRSVNGKTGAVVIDQTDIDSTMGNGDLSGDLSELSGLVTDLSNKLPSYPAYQTPLNKGLISSSDGGVFRIKTSSGFVHTLNGCTGTATIVAGPNVSISNNTTLNRITITASGGGNGASTKASLWPALILGG